MTRPQIVAPVPRWQQVADWLREEIMSGRFPAGQPLPSEETLAADFGISRPTVRQGISALVGEGLLTVRRPYGTIVRDPHARPSHTDHRTLTLTADGYAEPDTSGWTDVDEPVFVRVNATAAQADLLGIEPGQPLAVREVLQHNASGARRAVRLYVPFAVLAELSAPWATDGRLPDPLALYTWLAGHAHRPEFTEHVRARMPVGDETQALHMQSGVPLLVVSRVARTEEKGRPVAVEETRTPGDHTEISYPVPVTTPASASGKRTAARPSRAPARTR